MSSKLVRLVSAARRRRAAGRARGRRRRSRPPVACPPRSRSGRCSPATGRSPLRTARPARTATCRPPGTPTPTATCRCLRASTPLTFGGRNAPTWAYTAWSPPLFTQYDEPAAVWIGGMFWDGRAAGWELSPLAVQARGPFLNPVEMQNPIRGRGDPRGPQRAVRRPLPPRVRPTTASQTSTRPTTTWPARSPPTSRRACGQHVQPPATTPTWPVTRAPSTTQEKDRPRALQRQGAVHTSATRVPLGPIRRASPRARRCSPTTPTTTSASPGTRPLGCAPLQALTGVDHGLRGFLARPRR